jgi:hypothetical protein
MMSSVRNIHPGIVITGYYKQNRTDETVTALVSEETARCHITHIRRDWRTLNARMAHVVYKIGWFMALNPKRNVEINIFFIIIWQKPMFD